MGRKTQEGRTDLLQTTSYRTLNVMKNLWLTER